MLERLEVILGSFAKPTEATLIADKLERLRELVGMTDPEMLKPFYDLIVTFKEDQSELFVKMSTLPTDPEQLRAFLSLASMKNSPSKSTHALFVKFKREFKKMLAIYESAI